MAPSWLSSLVSVANALTFTLFYPQLESQNHNPQTALPNMFKLLEDRLTFVVRNVAIPQAINKYIINKPIFGSYVATVVVWLCVFFACRIFYYIFLYPVYFSPFRHLPTPKVRLLVTHRSSALLNHDN